MADDLSPAEAAPASLVRPPREDIRVHRTRFAIAYVVLAALAGAAVGAAILLVDRPETAGAAWSTWRPEGDEDDYPERIAEHVAGRYQLPSGAQLVGILAGPPQVSSSEQNVKVRAVAIRPADGDQDDIRIVETNNSLMYVMCGLGDSCSIAEGETNQRDRLLRREALELALYTFKYVDDTDSVIVLMPPNVQEQESTALFFQKRDFGRELDQPLQLTLARPELPPTAELDPAEGLIVDKLTRPRLFSYEFQALQEGSAIIVLAPVGVAQTP